MHEYTGHFDSGSSPQVNPHESVLPAAGPMPGTEPIPEAEGPPSEGSSRAGRSGPGARIHVGLPSWDTRAKLAVVVSFVVLVTVLVMNRHRLKGKGSAAPVTAISQRSSADDREKVDRSDKTDSPPAAKEDSESPPRAPTASAPQEPADDKPPGVAAPRRAASETTSSEVVPKDVVEEPAKPTAHVADDKEAAPPLDPPASKPADRKVVAAAIADEPVPPLDDKKPRDEAPADDKPPSVNDPKPSTTDPVDVVPAKPIAEEPAPAATTMPPLSKVPSTTENGKPPVADPPAADSPETAAEGRYSIPSAGLVRTANPSVKTPSPSTPPTAVAAAGTPASLPVAANDDGTLHVVRRGENFWTIARYHYASGRFYKALWYANRDLAKTPEDLYVGTAIRIPPVEDLNRELIDAPRAARADAPATAAAPSRKGSSRDGSAERAAAEGQPQAALPMDKSDPSKPIPRRPEARRKPEATYRTYVVRGRNETLRSVARTQLGDSDRDAEIEALNRDEFSDDSLRLKVGMTLKLPDDARTR